MRRACVVGAGLAGTFAARALLECGWSVRWVEESGHPAPRASGNPAGIFKPILSPKATLPSQLSFLSFDYLVKQLELWEGRGIAPPHSRRGLLQVALTSDEEARFRRALHEREISSAVAEFRDSEWVSKTTGISRAHGGVWFHQGGWIDPGELCRRIYQDLETRFAPSGQLEIRFGSAFEPSQALGCDRLVFCTAEGVRGLSEFKSLKTQVIRGQLSVLKMGDLPITDFPVSFHEYWIPIGGGRVVLGATHDRDDETTEARSEDHRKLLTRIGTHLPEVWKGRREILQPESMRAGLRFTRASHLPVVGSLPESSARYGIPTYAMTAFGSRGILLAPLLAEHLLSLLENRDSTLPLELVEALRK